MALRLISGGGGGCRNFAGVNSGDEIIRNVGMFANFLIYFLQCRLRRRDFFDPKSPLQIVRLRFLDCLDSVSCRISSDYCFFLIMNAFVFSIRCYCSHWRMLDSRSDILMS